MVPRVDLSQLSFLSFIIHVSEKFLGFYLLYFLFFFYFLPTCAGSSWLDLHGSCRLRRAVHAAPVAQRPPTFRTPATTDYFCFNDSPVPSEDKWRNGAVCSLTPRLRSRIDKWSKFTIRKIGLCSPALFIYSHGKESSWSSWHKGWASSPQESARALYSSDTSPASYFCSPFQHQRNHSCYF